MRRPSLGQGAILAALAVLSTGAAACSKAEPARAEPAAAPPPPPANAAPTAPPVMQPEPANAPPAAPSAAAAPVIDAGAERHLAPRGRKTGSAACGATSCSEDMKKGGK